MKVDKINAEKALEASLLLASQEPEKSDKFGEHAPIYAATTINTKGVVDLYKKEISDFYNSVDRALVVGTQGSWFFELLLNGVRNIDCFDKNILQYLYFELVLSVVKNFSYDDFISYFTRGELELDNGELVCFGKMLDMELFERLIRNKLLKPSVLYYWEKLTSAIKVDEAFYQTNLFRGAYILNSEFLSVISSLYNKKTYYEIQDILNYERYNLDYRVCDVLNIDREFSGRCYDIVMFDNIFEYYIDIPSLNSIQLIDCFIKGKIESMVSSDGIIQVGYGYEDSSFLVGGLIGKKVDIKISDIGKSFSEIMTSLKIRREYDLIYKMMKSFPEDYRVDFIDGTEDVLANSLGKGKNSYKPKNVVLSRIKKL